jgi:mono/diheme cytochrome c family protein
MPYRRFTFAVACLASVAVIACNDDSVGPNIPLTPGSTFADVRQILQDDCSGCHGAAGDRAFQAGSDSASLVGSGFIDPTSPDQSLLVLKPRSLAHGGGIVSAFSTSDSLAIVTWIAEQPATGSTRLTAVRATGAVSADGSDAEDSWRNTKWFAAKIGGGWADAREIYLKALYDNTYLYVLVKWQDDAASYKRQPFVKNADGSWGKSAAKPLPADGVEWASYMSQGFDEEGPSMLYEDKLAFAWNTYGASTSPGFEQNGCAALCHDPSKNGQPGTRYYYSDPKLASKKYTNAASEIVDLWHWKLVRHNDAFKMDDQYVRNWVVGDAGEADGGRASDAGASGYTDNPALSDGRPTYRGKSINAAPFFSFPRADTIRLTAPELDALPIGAYIASMMTSPLDGTRADIDGRGYYNPNTKTWLYEIKRKLVTGDSKDVQFDNLTREYKFGVAVFDNAQIEHSWSPAVLRLIFRQ